MGKPVTGGRNRGVLSVDLMAKVTNGRADMEILNKDKAVLVSKFIYESFREQQLGLQLIDMRGR